MEPQEYLDCVEIYHEYQKVCAHAVSLLSLRDGVVGSLLARGDLSFTNESVWGQVCHLLRALINVYTMDYNAICKAQGTPEHPLTEQLRTLLQGKGL